MKKLFSLFAAVLFAGSMIAADATMTAGTNGSAAVVNSKDAIKCGTSKAAGDMTITVGTGATSLTVYAAAWKGVSGASITITAPEGVTVTPASLSLTADDGISNNSPFTLVGDEASFKFDIVLSGVSASTDLTFACEKRFVIWGATYSVGAAVHATAIALDHNTLDMVQYKSATLTAQLTPNDATDAVVWSSSDETVATVNAGKVKALKAGTAKIFARVSDELADSCVVTITAQAPITCAAAAALAAEVENNNDLVANGQYVIRGYVTGIKTAYSDQYNNISVWMADAADGGEVFQAYRATIKGELTAEVGDFVEVVGDITKYNTTYETAAGCTIEVLSRPMAGTYNIGGENADYATLSAAATDLRAKGLKGDVTLLICADIAEVANVGLVNETDYTITVAPNAAVKRTISFGTVPDNVGPSGHIMIGYDMAAWASTDTKNVVIDGSFEGEGQYLEIEGGTIGGVEVVYYGYVTKSVVKNCRIISPRTSNTTYVVHFRSEKGSDKAPTGVGFENCYMQVTGVANAQAVYFNGSQSATAAGKPKDCYLKDCEIVSNLRGIFFNGAINATFEGNTFRLPNASGGYIAHAIMGNAQKGTIIVRGNKFIENGSTNANEGAYGLQAITASGGSDVWVIENNYFAGMDSKAATENKSVVLTYIRCGDSCVVRHNTFYLPSLTHKPGTAMVAAQAISCVWLAGSSKYPVENNIFVSAETVANNSLIRGALNENVKNNVFFHDGGNAAILAGAVVAADSAAFFALEGTAGSKWKLPVFANAATGDLSITTADADLLMPRLEDILVDITGADRRENTYAGAFEGPEPSPTTAIDAVKVEGIQKIFRNGEVLIIRDGKTYNMMGQIVE